MEIHSQSIAQLSTGLQRKDFSSEEVTRAFLERIKSLDHLYNAFITVNEEEAMSALFVSLRLSLWNIKPRKFLLWYGS